MAPAERVGAEGRHRHEGLTVRAGAQLPHWGETSRPSGEDGRRVTARPDFERKRVVMGWPETRQADIETFQSLDPPTRALILRMLARPTHDDREELSHHPNGEMLSAWLHRLPAYTGGSQH